MATTARYILALDQGTTSSRALLVSRAGKIVAQAQKELTQHFPQPGWVEHDPEEIWRDQLAVARSVLRKAKTDARSLAGIGIANQRETTVVWDRRTGEPIYNAIVWQDRRTASVCDRLKKSKWSAEFPQRTGLVIDAYFSGTKIAWILDHVPGARKLARTGQLAFGTVDAWLLWKLTGGKESQGAMHKTDVTNACRSLVCGLDGQWDSELARALKIPTSVLPEIGSTSGVFGETDAKLFGRSVPIASMAGDQHAALFGQLCVEPGMVKNTYGTGCFMLMNVGKKPKRSHNNLLTTPGWQLGSKAGSRSRAQIQYALEGSVFVAGAVVQWLRDGLGIIKKSSDVEKLAAQVEDSGGVIVVPAFTGLGAPHWDSYARGTLLGLTRGTSSAHIARAAVDSIAFQTADIIDAMRQDSGVKIRSLRVDGGAAANDSLMQFQADLLGVPVIRPKALETTALGAAFLAGLAVGFWPDVAALQKIWKPEKSFEPKMTRPRAKELRHEWSRAVERAKGWAKSD